MPISAELTICVENISTNRRKNHQQQPRTSSSFSQPPILHHPCACRALKLDPGCTYTSFHVVAVFRYYYCENRNKWSIVLFFMYSPRHLL
jgi:hypothetical protein